MDKGSSGFSFCVSWNLTCLHSPFTNLGGFSVLELLWRSHSLHKDLDRLSGWQVWNYLIFTGCNSCKTTSLEQTYSQHTNINFPKNSAALQTKEGQEEEYNFL